MTDETAKIAVRLIEEMRAEMKAHLAGLRADIATKADIAGLMAQILRIEVGLAAIQTKLRVLSPPTS